MRKTLAALATTVTVLATGMATPASAMTIEHVGTDCRINLTIEEMPLLNTWHPVYLTQEQIEQQLASFDYYIASWGPEHASDDPETEARRVAKYEAHVKFKAAMQECQNIPKETEAPAPVESESSSTGNMFAGILGGIIGAIVAVLAMLGLNF